MEDRTDRLAARDRASRAALVSSRVFPVNLAVSAAARDDWPAAERHARAALRLYPRNIAALCVLGDAAKRAAIWTEAERLFRLALDVEPHFTEAALKLVQLLSMRDGESEALERLTALHDDYPARSDILHERAILLAQIGRYDEAVRDLTKLSRTFDQSADVWISLANLQSTIAQMDESVTSFRRAILLDEARGDAWWGLANLKTFHFTGDEFQQLQKITARISSPSPKQASLFFALGKALEDVGRYETAFEKYDLGNRALCRASSYSASAMSDEISRSISYFQRIDATEKGPSDAGPIFIVGLPRSGSTLIEQILSSHSQVEGTSELPYIPMLIHRLLSEHWTDCSLRYPEVLDRISPDRLKELGLRYLQAASQHRHTKRPFFIDKLPNNWTYIPFIKLILPQARIIDARRHALACCWSNYKQWFAKGQEFSYDLHNLGRYYRDYLRFMQHLDTVAPGAVIRVCHDELIQNPEDHILKLLSALGLGFEQTCLDFHQNRRPVRTASAQQVRQPIRRDTGEQWKHFEYYLRPLKEALGVGT